MAASLGIWAQAVIGQNSYPVQGSGLQVYPTPSMPYSRYPYTHKKRMPKKATPANGKFFALYPTPQAAPLKTQKMMMKLPPNRGVSVVGPRSIHYPTLYRNPTPVRILGSH